MILLLRAIFAALGQVLTGQDRAAAQAASDKADTNARLDALEAHLAELSAAVEHLRVLVEGDTLIAAVGAPAFTPAAGEHQ
jgi:hypothetical protein